MSAADALVSYATAQRDAAFERGDLENFERFGHVLRLARLALSDLTRARAAPSPSGKERG